MQYLIRMEGITRLNPCRAAGYVWSRQTTCISNPLSYLEYLNWYVIAAYSSPYLEFSSTLHGCHI